VRIPSARVQIPSGRCEFSLSDSLRNSLGNTRGDRSERRIGEIDQWGGGVDDNCGGAAKSPIFPQLRELRDFTRAPATASEQRAERGAE
jgi:hypothetical protein